VHEQKLAEIERSDQEKCERSKDQSGFYKSAAAPPFVSHLFLHRGS
jgi:hypothetical protein